uniref:Autophagy-related protein 101 n=1 Tax=Plectus sambesii TaxID=2011161 RepID=A0A914X0V0_9BILA
MNARNQQFQLTVESRQLKEAVSCVFHTLLLHRSVGKFRYKAEGSYSVGVVGTEDVDCDYVDLTYVRANSPELTDLLESDVGAFCDAIGSVPQTVVSGRIALEFFQKRKRQWPLPEDVVPWEIWQLQVDVVRVESENEYHRLRDSVGECLGDAVLTVCGAVNRPLYLPKMPIQSDLSLVFDTRLSDIQPYLFRVVHQLGSGPGDYHRRMLKPGETLLPGASEGLSTTVRKLLKDTLSL